MSTPHNFITTTSNYLSDHFQSGSPERHPLAHDQGGLNLNDQSNNISIQKLTGIVIKQLGSQIISGRINNLMNVRKPIEICKEITYLETIANEQLYASKFLKIASRSNHLQQMQLIVAYLIAGLHVNGPQLLSKAPLEPFLGETLQLEKDDGTKYYGEQIAVDPQVSRFQIISPDNSFEVYGKNNIKVSFKENVNSVACQSLGEVIIKFADGNIYQCTTPEIVVSGLIVGERVLNYRGSQRIYCSQTNLHAEIIFHYNSPSNLGYVNRRLVELFKRNEENVKLSDFVDINIYKKQIVDGEEITIPLATGEGSWLQDVRFDRKMVWRITDKIDKWKRQKNLLCSDSSQRKDLQLLINKKLKEAKLMKQFLEDLEEQDYKLRTQFQL